STTALIAELTSVLEAQVERIRAALADVRPLTAKPDDFDHETTARAVARLMSLIDANDGDAMDAVHEVANALAGKVEPGSLDALRDAIGEFDFAEARTKLSQIAREYHLTAESQNDDDRREKDYSTR